MAQCQGKEDGDCRYCVSNLAYHWTLLFDGVVMILKFLDNHSIRLSIFGKTKSYFVLSHSPSPRCAYQRKRHLHSSNIVGPRFPNWVNLKMSNLLSIFTCQKPTHQNIIVFQFCMNVEHLQLSKTQNGPERPTSASILDKPDLSSAVQCHLCRSMAVHLDQDGDYLDPVTRYHSSIQICGALDEIYSDHRCG